MLTKTGILQSQIARFHRPVLFFGSIIRNRIWVLVLISTFAFALSGTGLPPAAHATTDDLETQRILTPEAIVSGGERLEIRVGLARYMIEEPTDEDRGIYDALPDSEKLSFLSKRRAFLSALTRSLNAVKYVFSVGSLLRKNESSDGPKSRAEAIVAKLLNRVDKSLWLQAPLFARSNEFGIVLAGGLEFIAGHKDKGWGGLVDFGITVGYNRDERALTIQIIRDLEHYQKSALPVVFLTGALTKAGFYVANQKDQDLKSEGISFYPPMAPAFSSVTPNNFMTGFSTGLTWPPSPVGDMLTYTDKLDQTVILRLSISPLLKGFVRITSGLDTGGHLRVVTEPVKKAVRAILRQLKPKKCEDHLE